MISQKLVQLLLLGKYPTARLSTKTNEQFSVSFVVMAYAIDADDVKSSCSYGSSDECCEDAAEFLSDYPGGGAMRSWILQGIREDKCNSVMAASIGNWFIQEGLF